MGQIFDILGQPDSLDQGLTSLVDTISSSLGQEVFFLSIWIVIITGARLVGEGVLVINRCFWSCVRSGCLSRSELLHGCPVRIQLDNAMAVAYVNHQGGEFSSTAKGFLHSSVGGTSRVDSMFRS